MRNRQTLFVIAALALSGLIALVAPMLSDMEGDKVPEFSFLVPEKAEVTILEVTTGTLPNGAELQLTDPTGAIVAVVSFFGQVNPAQIQYHQVPLLSDIVRSGEIVVTGIVVTAQGRRAALPSEFLGVKVLEN